jgi:hypothetical protein
MQILLQNKRRKQLKKRNKKKKVKKGAYKRLAS